MLKRNLKLKSKSETQLEKSLRSYDNNFEYPFTKSVNILKYPDKFAKGNSKGLSTIPDYYFDDDPAYIGFKANKYNDINWLEGYGKKSTSSRFQSNQSLKLPRITNRERTVDSIKSTTKQENTTFFLHEITRYSPFKECRFVRDVGTSMSDHDPPEQELKYKKTTINLNEETKPEDEEVVYYLVDDDEDLDYGYAPPSYPQYYPSQPYYNYWPSPQPSPPRNLFHGFNLNNNLLSYNSGRRF